MNSKFTDGQIKTYASAFREGDAIWSDGEWWEVSNGKPTRSLKCESPNQYVIRWFDGEVAIDGFKEHEDTAYRVTTIDDYELQGGEKLVRLKYNCGRLTVGKSYKLSEVKDSDGYYWIIGDGGDKFYIHEDNYLDNWGIIPRYEQVKNNEKHNVSDEEFDKFLNDLDKTLAPVKKDNQLEHVVHYPTSADREEEVLKLQTFELFTSENTSEEIIQELKEIAVIGINKGDYEESIKAIELIKEWEENSK